MKSCYEKSEAVSSGDSLGCGGSQGKDAKQRHLSFHQILASHKYESDRSGHAVQSRTTIYNYARSEDAALVSN